MKKLLIIGFPLIFLNFSWLMAQDNELDEDYIREFIYGINLNTNGGLIGGLNFKATKIIKPKVYRSFGFEIVGIKSPKEDRFTSPATNNSFIYGKKNYLYSIRLQYGRDYILFRKAAEDGVQVNAHFEAGPSLGLIVPYYIQVARQGSTPRSRTLVSEAYDPTKHSLRDIFGVGSLFQGFGQTDFALGLNARIGLSLDFGTFRNSISGIDAGFTFEAFTKTPQIMVSPIPSDPPTQNQSIFTAAYLTFFFGNRR